MDALLFLDYKKATFPEPPRKMSAKRRLAPTVNDHALSSTGIETQRLVDTMLPSFLLSAVVPTVEALASLGPVRDALPVMPIPKRQSLDLPWGRLAAYAQWRPTVHFLPPGGWINDPCGCVTLLSFRSRRH